MARGKPSIAVSEARGLRTLHVGGEALQSSMRIEDPFALLDRQAKAAPAPVSHKVFLAVHGNLILEPVQLAEEHGKGDR